MVKTNLVICAALSGLVIACSPQETTTAQTPDTTAPSTQVDNADLMQEEFMESCRARPEYVSRKRAGTLDKYCKCIFDVTMRGLTDPERAFAGFYLYGEQHEAFQTRFTARFKDAPFDAEAMGAAVKAVGRAAETCR